MNLSMQVSVGEGTDPFASSKSPRLKLQAVRRILKAIAGGGLLSRSASRPTVKAGTGHSSALLTLATCAAGTVVDVNGVPFTAITGDAVAANDEFDIDGTDIADATDLCRAINACTNAKVSGVVEACNFTAIATLTTAVAGNKITIAGVTFTGKGGAVDLGSEYFSVDTGNNAAAASLAAQINAHAYLSTLVRAEAASAVVTIRQRRGTTGLQVTDDNTPIALTGVTANLMIATDDILVSAIGKGAVGNGVTVKTLGIGASATATVATAIATDTLLVNGQQLLGIVQRATQTLTCVTCIAGDTAVVNGVTFTCRASVADAGKDFLTKAAATDDTGTAVSLAAAINASVDPLILGLITATSALGVVTVRAVAAGTTANAYTTTTTGGTITAGDTTMLGGIAVANNEFDTSPGSTDTQVAADIVRAINATTTALIYDHVRATSAAAVVTVRAKAPGTIGNAIGLSSTGGTITCSAAQLAGGTTLAHEGAQASCTLTLASVLNAQTVTINGVVITAHTNTQANNQFTIAGDDLGAAAALALAINNSTTAALADVIASVATNVVTVKARRGGISGNAITVAASAATVTIGGSAVSGKFGAGAPPTTVVPSAERLSGGSEATLTF